LREAEARAVEKFRSSREFGRPAAHGYSEGCNGTKLQVGEAYSQYPMDLASLPMSEEMVTLMSSLEAPDTLGRLPVNVSVFLP
jgi:hypothetical protein